jgi:hypothetical protein
MTIRFSVLRCFGIALRVGLLFGAVGAARAGTLTGTVRNGTHGTPGAGVDIILMSLQGGMQPVANTKTDSQGHYRLDNSALGAEPMLLRAVYRGVLYHEPVPPGKTTVDVEVFEPTEKSSAIAVAFHAVILQPTSSGLLVGEEYSIENKTQPPLAYYRDDGSFVFALPDDAQLKDISAVHASGVPTVQGVIDKGKNLEAIAYPFRPGESGVRISYNLPYPGNQARLHFVSPYAAERVAVFVPPSVQFSADGFSTAGQEQGFSVYMRAAVPANAPVNVSISGTAPASSASQTGSTLSTAPEGEASQNPSVNSRADSGGEAPTAMATTMPARLDSLKWILVAGFIAVFALGFMYLWCRPHMAPRGAAASVVLTPPQTPPQASPKADVMAATTREVQGSLDELKDRLFRLELRRQAGTIGEKDYSQERQQIEQLLRDLVRG